jgi:ribokinase
MPVSRPNEVLVIGSSNTDLVFTTERLPAPGETILGEDFIIAQGGKGANQAVAAARAGAGVSFVSCVGDDAFGKQSVASVEAEGINTEYVSVISGQASGVAAILVDLGGENTIVVAPGANRWLTPDLVEKAEPAFTDAAVCLVQLECPVESVQRAVEMAREHHIPVILNPAPAAVLPSGIFEQVYLITPNETETEHLVGIRPDTKEKTVEAGRLLIQKGVKHVIITLGAQGAMLVNDTHEVQIPAPRVTATDTTAAGDAFNGALAAALSAGSELEDAIRLANSAGALAVTRQGAQPSLPYLNEILKLT